jgi:hypothetical protein
MAAEREVGGLVYVFKTDHRDDSREKSQWRITPDEEIVSFELMREKAWNVARQGWSLHLEGERICYLGVSIDRTRELFIAKFLGEPAVSRWHGFPADYQVHVQDIPDGGILLAWVELRYLTVAKMRKILRQQRCRI